MSVKRSGWLRVLWAVVVWSQLEAAARADMVLSLVNVPRRVNFEDDVDDVLAGPFAGLGLAPVPLPGQLDSDSWQVLGLRGGNNVFGGSYNSGSFARGLSPGGVTTGGLYAMQDGAERWLGLQPSTTDFTPGSLVLRVRNETGQAIQDWRIGYDFLYLNNESRASQLRLAISSDNLTYFDLPQLAVVTPLLPDVSPVWQRIVLSTTFSLPVPTTGRFYVRWHGSDFGGSGARDEFGLDNLSLTPLAPAAVPEPATWLLVLCGGWPVLWCRRGRQPRGP